MSRRKSPLVSALFKLTRSGLRQGSRISRATTRQGLAAGSKMASAAGRLLSGVATPAKAPAGVAGGRWEEGRWGPGPLALRRYRLFIPTGATARQPLPLLILLHGCGQDSASFAAVTRCASVARARGFAVLLPEQASEANPQRCWNWFGGELKVGLEVQILMSIVDHVIGTHPRVAGPLFALGLSAGGAMALTLALRHPDRFAGVGSHSGAAPHSAATPLQAAQAMAGHRAPEGAVVPWRLPAQGLPPLVLIHGDADGLVAPANARRVAAFWLEQLPEGALVRQSLSEVRRGGRRSFSRSDSRLAGRPYVRLLSIHGLAHAWSGGAPRQAFSDPAGPDALRLAWQFFSACRGQAKATP